MLTAFSWFARVHIAESNRRWGGVFLAESELAKVSTYYPPSFSVGVGLGPLLI